MKGRGKTWKVFLPDASNYATAIPVLDKDGVVVDVLYCGAPSDKLYESFAVFASQEDAVAYAESLGFAEVKVTKLRTPSEAMALARRARKGKSGEA